MLTKKDLEDIGALIDKALDKRLAIQEENYDRKLDNRLKQQTENYDRKLDTRFKQQESDYDKKMDGRFKQQDDNFDKKLKPIYKILNKIQKDINTAIDFFDEDVTDLKVRMDRVETRLQLPPVIAN